MIGLELSRAGHLHELLAEVVPRLSEAQDSFKGTPGTPSVPKGSIMSSTACVTTFRKQENCLCSPMLQAPGLTEDCREHVRTALALEVFGPVPRRPSALLTSSSLCCSILQPAWWSRHRVSRQSTHTRKTKFACGTVRRPGPWRCSKRC